MIRVIETVDGIREFVAGCRKRGQRTGFVPTMGAFHAGHLSLMHHAKNNGDSLIVSIFVNPMQFAAGEDYDRYPRQLAKDLKMAETAKADVMFFPPVAEMYPKGFTTFVDQNDLSDTMCGHSRPGHFRGVMTVVSKLFNIVQPDVAYFGQKDYQQYLIIRRMALDLNLDVDVRVRPTVREEDGVAMSSRNAYLGPKQRRDATCLYRALQRAEELVGTGVTSAARVTAEMKRIIRRVKGTRIDYIATVNSESLEPVKEIKAKTLVALAVRIGKARLIDNIII